jgi:small subunit ribosomal protein S17
VPIKQFNGVVVSNKMQKTVVVAVENRSAHTKYGKVLVRTRKYKVHDEYNHCKVGDKVRIFETRPLSRTKRWALDKIFPRISPPSHSKEKPCNQSGGIQMIYGSEKIIFPEKVHIGRLYIMRVEIFIDDKFDLESSKMLQQIDTYIMASESDFELGDRKKTIDLSLPEEQRFTTFNVVPKSKGVKEIDIAFFQCGRYIGSTKIKTEVNEV